MHTILTYLGAVQAIKNIGQAEVGLLPLGLLPLGIYESIKWAINIKAGFGRMTGKLTSGAQGLAAKASGRVKESNFYQRRQMARDNLKQERRRANVEDYAKRMTASGNPIQRARAKMLQRRAAGWGNEAGQQRAYVGGLSQLEHQETEEMKQASQVLDANRITNPSEFRAIAEGRTGQGVTGSTVSGAGNTAMRQAAIQKIIDAGDAEQLEGLFQNLTSQQDQEMLVSLLQKGSNYSSVKGTGAHLVKMGPQAGGYSSDQINAQALQHLSALKTDQLASQDGPSWDSAAAGFNTANMATDPGERASTLASRQALWESVQRIAADKRAEAQLKGASRAAYDAIRMTSKPIT